MLIALTHIVSPHMNQCELTYMEREPILYDLAQKQHDEYRGALERSGARVTLMKENEQYPDSSFVEDIAIVVDEIALLTSMGAASRRGESQAMEKALQPYRDIVHIELPATVEGGDILRNGNTIYVGQSTRTNKLGFEALRDHLIPLGYAVKPVPVPGALHLKTACTLVDPETLIANPKWVDLEPFSGLNILEVPQDEPWAGNVLAVNGNLIIHEGFVKTIDVLQDAGYKIEATNISEYMKAEAGVTCMSVVFPDVPLN